jgi:hypothetical protein
MVLGVVFHYGFHFALEGLQEGRIKAHLHGDSQVWLVLCLVSRTPGLGGEVVFTSP